MGKLIHFDRLKNEWIIGTDCGVLRCHENEIESIKGLSHMVHSLEGKLNLIM